MTNLTSTVRKGVFWVGLSSVLNKAVGLITLLIILRSLSVYEYGVVELALSIIPMLSIFLVPGLSNAVIADIGVEKSKGNLGAAKTIFVNFFKLQFVLSFIAWALVFFGAELISNFYSAQIVFILQIVSFIFLVSPLRVMVTVFQSVELRFFKQSLFTFTEETIKLVFVFCLLKVFDYGSLGLVISIVGSQVINLFVYSPFLWIAYKKTFGKSLASGDSLLSLIKGHNLWGILSNYLSNANQSIRLWIIKLLISTEAVGLFAVAYGLVGHAKSLLPLSNILQPIIPQYMDDKDRFYRIIKKGIKYQLVMSTFVVVVSLLVFPKVVEFFFPAYLESIDLFRIMIFSLIAGAFSLVFNSVFYAIKAQKDLARAVLIRTIISTGLLFILIPAIGVTGVALEFLLTGFIFTVERYRRLKILLVEFSLGFKDILYFSKDELSIFLKPIKFLKKSISY